MASFRTITKISKHKVFRNPDSKLLWVFNKHKLYVSSMVNNKQVVENSTVAVQLTTWMKFYEDVIGLTEVKEAQKQVLKAEQKFLDNQEQRRERQRQIQQVQVKLKEIQLELDKTLRGEDRYLQLVTQEHSILKEEKNLSDEFKFYEKGERECFSALSSAVRDSHEKERAYAEKTKYWSIIGSVCGAIIGIVGTTINNWVRIRELRGIVEEAKTSTFTTTATMPKLHTMFHEITNMVSTQQEQVTSFINSIQQANPPGKTVLNLPSSKLATVSDILSIKQQNDHLKDDLFEIKTLLTAKELMSDLEATNEPNRGAIVYLGRDVERLVKDAQHNLEWKIKINSLATVAMIYGAFAISLPIVYKIFGGTS